VRWTIQCTGFAGYVGMGLRVVRQEKVGDFGPSQTVRVWKRCSNTARALNLGPSVEANGDCALSRARQSKKNTIRATPAPVEGAPGDGCPCDQRVRGPLRLQTSMAA
jgi:hypothetical protein